MSRKQSRVQDDGAQPNRAKEPSRNSGRTQLIAPAPSPLLPRRKAVMVKDVLGDFSEQTGASFG